jgi:endoglucanase
MSWADVGGTMAMRVWRVMLAVPLAMSAMAAPAVAARPAAGLASSTAPTLTLSPPGGAAIKVRGTGWQPGETVDFYLDTEWGTTWLGHSPAASGVVPTTILPLPEWLQTDASHTSNCFVVTLNGTTPSFGQGCHYSLVAMQQGSLDMASAGFNLSITGSTWTIAFPNHIATADGQADGGCRHEVASPLSEPPLTPDLPLHITGSVADPGRWIVDAAGRRFKLAAVNWYGAEEADYVPAGLQCQTAAAIAQQIRDAGFNAVRLPWSNAMEELDPSVCTQMNPDPTDPFGAGEECIPPEALAANSGLLHQDALSTYESIIGALASDGIVVILDNHSTDAAWSPSSYDGLWWGGLIWDDQDGLGQDWQKRTVKWDEDWDSLVGYLSAGPYSQYIVGADLRNEPSLVPTYAYSPDHSPSGPCDAYKPQCAASWTATSPAGAPGTGCISQTTGPLPTNWLAAAEEAGNTVLCADPNLLVMVEGISFAQDLSAVKKDGPTQKCAAGTATTQVCLLSQSSTSPPHVVYSAHAYPPSGASSQNYGGVTGAFGNNWGYILSQGRSYTAPVWVGEFGATAATVPSFTPTTSESPCGTTKTDNGPWLNCFINYLASNDTDWSYWALNGSKADEGIARGADPNPNDPGNSGADAEPNALYTQERYGILDPGWATPSSPKLLADLQRIQIPSQGPGSWTPIEAPVPAGAYPAGLNGVSCPAKGSCDAVGSYTDTSGNEQGLIETSSGHTWTPAEAPVPANASGTPDTYLSSVTCPASGSCTAGGDYSDTSGGVDPLIETLSGGTWTPSELPQPGNAAVAPNAGLFAVSCPFGSCTAVGYYFDSSSTMQGLIETGSGSTWTAAEAPLPANAGSNPHVILASVNCPALGSCTAVGSYTDTSDNSQALIETLSGGTWTAAQAPLPANAGSGQGGDLQSVTCLTGDSCTAVGGYFDAGGNSQGMVDTFTDGTWTAVQAPVPANAGTNPLVSLGSVTCLADGSCTAVGSYTDTSGNGQAMIDTFSGGTWTAAEAALEANSVSSPYSFLSAVDCPAAGSCTAVGTYVDALGDEGLIDTQNPPQP